MKITVNDEALECFWVEPAEGHTEFWAFRYPVVAQIGEPIAFIHNRKVIAFAIISYIEKPGQSQCEHSGKFKNMWKVFWRNESFIDFSGREMSVHEFNKTFMNKHCPEWNQALAREKAGLPQLNIQEAPR